MIGPDNYYSIGAFYRQRFGKKITKIPVSISGDCPNRRGLKGMETCVFCDVWGSAAYPEQRQLGLKEQIQEKITLLGAKYKSDSFLVYFQAYTSTFMGVQYLRSAFEEALSFPQVKGLVIGTRPDCLSPAVFDLWNDFQKRCFVSVELGVQTFSDPQLKFLRRGHSAQSSRNAIAKIKKETNVDLGVHLMFGLPDETTEQIIETAQILSEFSVDNVKLHNLHVLKNTPLENLYNEGSFKPIDLEEYSRRVGIFLQYLSPDVAVHRLAALSSRWDELVAPDWTRHKMETYQHIVKHLKAHQIYQGQHYLGFEKP